MYFLKVATFLLVALAVEAEKKIELQDIEEDNLRSEMKSEKEKELNRSDVIQSTQGTQSKSTTTGSGFNSFNFLQNGLLKYLENSAQSPQQQQQRYIHQYAVTEQPETYEPILGKTYYNTPGHHQAMIGYLSNMPVQIHLVPQDHYDFPRFINSHRHLPDGNAGASRVAAYQAAPEEGNEEARRHPNYNELSVNGPHTGKTIVQHYPHPTLVTYVTYSTPPTSPETPATTPVLYRNPVIEYNPAVVAQLTSQHNRIAYYQNPEYDSFDEIPHTPEYIDSNHIHNQKQTSTTETESPFLPITQQFPRHYNTRAPIRKDHKHFGIPGLPHPNPILLKAPLPHLAHIPKSLPIHRPPKPVYQTHASNSFTPPPHDYYGPSLFKRRPTSLLDSYIPSSLQIQALNKGLVKEPLAAYDALASGRVSFATPRYYERGFRPNQMQTTAAGGITYENYKRTTKVD